MDYRELLEKYNRLLSENRRLINENERLKAQLGIAERKHPENRIAGPDTEKSICDHESTDRAPFSGVNNRFPEPSILPGPRTHSPNVVRMCNSHVPSRSEAVNPAKDGLTPTRILKRIAIRECSRICFTLFIFCSPLTGNSVVDLPPFFRTLHP